MHRIRSPMIFSNIAIVLVVMSPRNFNRLELLGPTVHSLSLFRRSPESLSIVYGKDS